MIRTLGFGNHDSDTTPWFSNQTQMRRRNGHLWNENGDQPIQLVAWGLCTGNINGDFDRPEASVAAKANRLLTFSRIAKQVLYEPHRNPRKPKTFCEAHPHTWPTDCMFFCRKFCAQPGLSPFVADTQSLISECQFLSSKLCWILNHSPWIRLCSSWRGS